MNAGDRLIRITTAGTVVALGCIAAVVSYRHALGVAQDHGETGVTAYLTPLTPDGLVLVASLVLLDAARRKAPAPVLARWALAMGIGGTVAVNVLHGLEHGPIGAVVAAWPAVTLVVVVELLMGVIRSRENATRWAGPVLASGGRAAGTLPVELGKPWPLPETGVPAAVASASQEVGPQVDGRVTDRSPWPDGREDEAVVTAREHFAEVLATGALPSIRAIRRELRVGHPRAVAIRDSLAAST